MNVLPTIQSIYITNLQEFTIPYPLISTCRRGRFLVLHLKQSNQKNIKPKQQKKIIKI